MLALSRRALFLLLTLILAACTQSIESFSTTNQNPSLPQVSYQGGTTLKSVDLQLIFWGQAWTSSDPSEEQVIQSVSSILSGSYLSALAQYGIKPGTIGKTILVTSYNPPNPFSTKDTQNLVQTLIANRSVPNPSTNPNLLYMVMLPFHDQTNDPGVGRHSYFSSFSYQPPFIPTVTLAHFAWITNNTDLGILTQRVSHELVESLTDPEFDGWQIQKGGASWQEIADVCEMANITQGDHPAQVDGVMVDPYWSNADQSCIIPISPSQLLFLHLDG